MMKAVYYSIQMEATQRDQLIRYLSDCAQRTIEQQRKIKEANKFEEIYDADTRCQLQSLTSQLKWFNKILDALQKAKKSERK